MTRITDGCRPRAAFGRAKTNQTAIERVRNVPSLDRGLIRLRPTPGEARRAGPHIREIRVIRGELNDVGFAGCLTRREAIELERRDIELRIPAGDQIGKDPSRRRRVLEAVAAESGDGVEPLDVR